jgi:hypothetical protein
MKPTPEQYDAFFTEVTEAQEAEVRLRNTYLGLVTRTNEFIVLCYREGNHWDGERTKAEATERAAKIEYVEAQTRRIQLAHMGAQGYAEAYAREHSYDIKL